MTLMTIQYMKEILERLRNISRNPFIYCQNNEQKLAKNDFLRPILYYNETLGIKKCLK